jgi:hypothetical protein
MIPIEWVAVLLWIAFGVIGLARRFPVELGSTIGFVAMLFSLELLGGRIGGAVISVLNALELSLDPSLAQWWLVTAVIAAWVFFMYSGHTLTFEGVWPPGRITGTALDITAGLLNGWIVVGTWWYVTDSLGYPIQQLGFYTPPLSESAQRLVGLTPPAVIPAPYSTVVFGTFLVLLIALRVFR